MRNRWREHAFWMKAALLIGLGISWTFGAAAEETTVWPRLDRLERLSNREGLSSNWVLDIQQDSDGFLWIGTDDGLNRFDGYEFRVYRHDPDDPESISNNYIARIYETADGRLWVATSAGLNVVDSTTGRARHFRHDPADPNSLAGDFVGDMEEDVEGNLWLVTGAGVDRLDTSEKVTHVDLGAEDAGILDAFKSRDGSVWLGGDGLYKAGSNATVQQMELVGAPDGPISYMTEDPDGFLWVGYFLGGLLRFDPRNNESREYSIGPRTGEIHSLHAKANGRLWIGTALRGLTILDPGTGDFETFRHRPDEPGSLSNDRIMTIFEDRTGITWMGTDTALNKYVPSREAFVPFQHRATDSASLSGNFVWPIVEDLDGFIWVGTVDDGLNRIDCRPTKPVVQRFPHDVTDSSGTRTDLIAGLHVDRQGDLWIVGSEGVVDRKRRGGVSFEALDGIVEDPADGFEGIVRAVTEAEDRVFWIGGVGLWRYEASSRRLTRYRHDEEDPNSRPAGTIYTLLGEREGVLWLGMHNSGLGRFDPEREAFESIMPNDEVSPGLSDDSVNALLRGRDGMLWIATPGGLDRLDTENRQFLDFPGRDDFSQSVISALVEDQDGFLWLGTRRGLIRLDTKTGTTKIYDSEDGLLADVVSFQAGGRTADGTLLFGTHSGLNLFDPRNLTSDPHPPEVRITDFQILNRSTPLGERLLPDLVLDHHEKIFSFNFAALHFASPEKNRYRYRLEGFQDEWVETDARQRFAQYTNLDADDYVFRVQASNPDGVWNDNGVVVNLRVLPPPWRSWWAYTAYALAGLGIVFFFVQSHRRELRYQRESAENERQINRRLREVDKLKDEFLANTSHELRTPLYGMTGLAESLIDGARGELPEKAHQDLEMIVASGRRLSSLVDDILDFAKLRHGEMGLRLKAIDLEALAEVVVALSKPMADSKSLEIRNQLTNDLPLVHADENRLQQILFNLVGNAIKFTDAGFVELNADVEPNEKWLKVSIRDTGIGIPENQQAGIFDAFKQVDASSEREFGGTGLGLAISRSLVELHGGAMTVQSKPGEGSVFSLTLPVVEGGVEVETATQDSRPVPRPNFSPVTDQDKSDTASRPPIEAEADILIVDDEPVVRRILANQLTSQGYRVSRAASGAEALEQLSKRRPDLVLLDVMMPKMSGFEVCRSLREQHSLEELPVIFLTAKSRVEDLVVGLAAGANDYLAKPISKSELLSRVRTHLDLLQNHRRVNDLLAERTSDLSEKERLLQERKKLVDDLEARNNELARFNYTVSHDLKNPMVTIKNFLGKLRMDAEAGRSESLGQNLEHVETASDRLAQMLEELFEFSRLGFEELPRQTVDFNVLVGEVLEELADKIDYRRITVEVQQGLPRVEGDRLRLRQMVRHLIDNAIRYLGEQAEPRIEIGYCFGDDGVFYIQDNGIGVEVRYHEKIFELFEHLGPRDSRHTGIGLALVRRIAELHGGRAWVESGGYGKGSTFCIAVRPV